MMMMMTDDDDDDDNDATQIPYNSAFHSIREKMSHIMALTKLCDNLYGLFCDLNVSQGHLKESQETTRNLIINEKKT